MKILVTGFEPFGGEDRNPSAEVVEKLPDKISGAEIVKLIIPVVREKSSTEIKKAVEKFSPDMILSIGQAGGRSAISVERVAVNLDDYRIPDNEGNQPVEEPVVPGGPDGYFCTVPAKQMVKAISEAGVPAQESLSAGTFVCNHVMYRTLHLLNTCYPDKTFGFIHIPYLPEQVTGKPGMPSMSLELSEKAIKTAIECMIKEMTR